MEIKDYMLMQLEGLKMGTDRVLASLSQEEIAWRPGSGCNSIGLILFHVFKGEDMFINETLQGKKLLWETEKWFQRLNLPITESGHNYTADQVNCFPTPLLKDLRAYVDAVRANTLNYLRTVKLEELDGKIKLPWGDFTVAGIISMTVTHAYQHLGEVSYLRGLQRGIDK
jgi:uncharacterized damage-inducible protein DinB